MDDEQTGSILPAVPLEPLRPHDPTELGPFRLLGRLGQGGMGVAFLSQSEGNWVVVKMMRSDLTDDSSFRARVGRELEALKTAAGTHTARLIDSDLSGHPAWFAMEFIPGTTLQRRVKEQGALTSQEVSTLAFNLAVVIGDVHSRGIVHRDLKPGNIMLSPTGPRLIDFGIADLSDGTQLTSTGTVLGSTGWLSPEQVTGDPVTAATDVHAWALCVLYAATGEPPFGNDSPTVSMYRVLEAAPEVPANIAEPLRSLLLAAVEKDANRRPSVERILAELGGIAPSATRGVASAGAAAVQGAAKNGEPSPGSVFTHAESANVPRGHQTSRTGGTRKIVIGAAVIVAIAVIAGLAFGLGRQGSTSEVANPENTLNQTDIATPADSSPETAAETASEAPLPVVEDVSFSLITKNQTNPFFVAMINGAEQAAEANNMALTVDSGSDDTDCEGQSRAVRKAITRGDQGILITPACSGVNGAITAAREAGMLVIALDTPTDPADIVDATFATDQYAAGQAIGQWAAGKLNGAKAVIARLIIVESESLVVDYHRDNGFLDGMGIDIADPTIIGDESTVGRYSTGKGGPYRIACVAESFANEDGGYSAMRDCLRKNPAINVVYAINEPAALGAAVALEAAGRTPGRDVQIVSIDGGISGVQSVKEGIIAATSQQSPYNMATAGAEAILRYAASGEYPTNTPGKNFFDTGIVLCTTEPQSTVTVAEQKTAQYCIDNAWG